MSKIYETLKYEKFTPAIQIKAGMVLKLDDGTFYLVGDVNKQLGACDDCMDFQKSQIVEFADILIDLNFWEAYAAFLKQ